MLAKKELREEDIATILQVAADDETPEVILQSIIPKLQSLPKLRRVLIRQLVVVGREKPSLEEPLRSTVSELVRQEIDSLESTQWDPSKIIHLLDFCADNSNIDCCGALLARVMEGASPAHSYATLEFINSVPRFSSWLAQHGKQPTWGGFPSFFTAIIHPWIQRRLGASRPADPTPQLLPLQQWRCDCRQCTEIRTLITTPDREKSSIYSSGNSQHLQESLVTFASGLLSWDPPTSYVVHIVKDPSFARAQQWPKNQAIALSAIRGISTDESVLLDVFGETNYRAILSALDEPNINHSLPHQPSVSSSSVGNEGGVGSAANPSSGNVPRAELSSPTQPPTKRRRVEDS
ncbi:hypothetical protein FRB90_007522 [Tulasnella sp. 427]|nr:hypothetical protein FRB90_007522 [Tulasnella sp. 427]